MNVSQFVKNHREDWNQLEDYISTLHKRKTNLSGEDIDTFHKLYLKTAQHLSYSQTHFKEEDVTAYLNGLVAKAHNLLYKDQTTSMKQMRYFFSTKFIGLLGAQWKFSVTAMLLFILGGVGGFISVMIDPLHLYSVVPAEMAQGVVDPEQLGANHDMIDASLMSTSIMTNNIQVAILAFAGGVTFGLLTVYILIFNGLLVGALAALFWHYDMTYEFWAYIVPHGMIELVAIFIAGGAGLLMGYKLFVPGSYSRVYQLKEYGKRSVQLLLGTIPLFIIAGVIEGFITPASISLEAKYIVAILTVVGLILYIALGYAFLKKNQIKENIDF
ncbi:MULTISPECIES: stage II sporulation protein M [Bacillaceae]|uniref:Stage II sporulation protein M n=1 Tax=Evansella alkalicola TaxID=745819 RepID=A0ABS6JV61_9BACI|nr:stage II sporulation protein M [Litchfieldia alkalitelluris]MBU9722373.1 stage II sporulation protein M [Bacillus alkalicola]